MGWNAIVAALWAALGLAMGALGSGLILRVEGPAAATDLATWTGVLALATGACAMALGVHGMFVSWRATS